jgi:hypothetical protein
MKIALNDWRINTADKKYKPTKCDHLHSPELHNFYLLLDCSVKMSNAENEYRISSITVHNLGRPSSNPSSYTAASRLEVDSCSHRTH